MSPAEHSIGREAVDGRIELTSSTVEHDDRPDECTLFPLLTVTKDERMSTWITAYGDSFVDCRGMR